MKKFACLILASLLIGCGRGENGGSSGSTTNQEINPADIVLGHINSPVNPVLAIATVRDGSETVSVLGLRDSAGKPTAITDLVYMTTRTSSKASVATGIYSAAASIAQYSVGIMKLDNTGLPLSITDSLGNTAAFQNYDLTNNTVNISVTTVNNGTTLPPVHSVFDPAIIKVSNALTPPTNPFELAGYALSAYGAWSCVAAAASGAVPIIPVACASTILNGVRVLTSNGIQELAETSGKLIEVSDCYVSKTDCISLALPVLQAVFKAPDKDFSGYYLGGTHQFYVNQSDTTVNGMFDNSSYSGKVYGDIMLLELNQFPQSCPGNVHLTGIFNNNTNTDNVPTLSYNLMGTDCIGKLVTDSGSTTFLPPAPQCTYSISSTNHSFGSSGGGGSLTVSTTNGCAWIAVSNSSWITVTSGSSGNDNGTILYTVEAYTGISDRTGTITIAGQAFTVTQTSLSTQCTYTYSAWSACQDNTESRTVTSSSPPGCVGTPVLTKSCTSPPPTCDVWTCYNNCYSAWMNCYDACPSSPASEALSCMSACDQAYSVCPSNTDLDTCSCY